MLCLPAPHWTGPNETTPSWNTLGNLLTDVGNINGPPLSPPKNTNIFPTWKLTATDNCYTVAWKSASFTLPHESCPASPPAQSCTRKETKY